MGVLKTFQTCAILAIACLPGTALHASSEQGLDQAGDRALVFASCLGRWSAMREHGWLMGSEDHEAEDRLDLFEMLLEAVFPDARAAGLDGPQILDARIHAKMAHAQLLTTATFGTDDRRRMSAQRMVTHHLGQCDRIVLG